MRGEENCNLGHINLDAGSPPHARGRERAGRVDLSQLRITPACAGKSGQRREPGIRRSDHPRMRGEEQPWSEHA